MSSSKILRVNDSINNVCDYILFPRQHVGLKGVVMIGRGGFHTDDKGMTQLGEVLFTKENMVVLGGVQFALEKLLGVKGSVETGYLNEQLGIGSQTEPPIQNTTSYPYAEGTTVCLFGVGTGGAGENMSTIADIKYNERQITDMIPIRFTNKPMSTTDADKYFGQKTVDGNTAYYLKKFDKEAQIKHLWKDGEEGEDGSVVDSSVFGSTSNIPIQSFAEMQLTLGKKDCKEWFTYMGEVERTRINSVALFSATYDPTTNDYMQIKMFSKLNIPTEMMSMSKELNILYRIYCS